MNNFDVSKDNGFVTVTYNGGAKVYYNERRSLVSISVPNGYGACGLCGNQDGDDANDVDGTSLVGSLPDVSYV